MYRYEPVFQPVTPLFVMLSTNAFYWSVNHEKKFRTLLHRLQTTAVLKPFSIGGNSAVITDALPTGIGAVLEHCVTCVSRRLDKAEHRYLRTQLGALGVYWVVKT
ncbi:uncharacterized protein DEA37_0003170 [Paragonimus westermani]|uniref:Reverse transcriptase/retrotransposon-derived protein RNase H-like domain-containing protein n=1 Tax=Paragonimus westermani TaxID=34504 RepID=A0A5J4N6E4_9TREM|nr:uncharacterized protein DEA37_0003170 [Paragonimus westermani]